MKKFRLPILLIIAMLSFCLLLVACDPPIPPSDEIIIDETSIETEYLVGEPFDLSKLKVKAMKDGVEKSVPFADLTLSEFSTAEAGEFEITVTYGDLTDKITLNVHTPEAGVNLEVLSFEVPASITAYNESIKEKNAENKRSEFMDRAEGYFVGTENDYILKPKVTAEKTIGTKFYAFTYDYESTITVEEVDGETLTALTGTDLTEVVSIDAKKGTFRFTEAALDRTFKLTIAVDPDEADPDLVGSFSHTVTIVEGFNAHNVAELAQLDNVNDAGNWTDFKTEHGLALTNSSKGVILHNNINITPDDLPASYFWTSGVGADGSLFDLTSIYKRYVTAEESFQFIGNYFTVNASEIPLVTRDNNEGEKLSNSNDVVIVSNVHLFLFYGASDNRGDVTMKNFNVVGNAPRSNDKKYSGGLTMMHCDVNRFEAYNNIAVKFITMYNAMTGSNENNVMKLTKTKSYDSFNSIIYMYNASYVYVEQSELIGSGSPVIIISNPQGNDPNRPTPRLIIDGFAKEVSDTASVIETQVTGQETWFQINGASSIASELGALSAGIETMSNLVSGGIYAASGGAIALPVRSFHKTEGNLTLFNPRVLIYPDNLNNNFFTKGEVYLGAENATHDASEWEVMLKMEEMTAAPSQTPIAELLGASQAYAVSQGSPYITSRGGEVPQLLQDALMLPAELGPEGVAIFQNDSTTDFILKDRLASTLDGSNLLNYISFFLGDHISLYAPILHEATDEGTPPPTSIGILLEYYTTPYTPA